MDDSIKRPKISVQELKGVNERKKFINADLGEFDELKGFVPTTDGALTKINGIGFLQYLGDTPILGICQTHDSRHNIIVQTRTQGIKIISESEFFNQAQYTPILNFSNLTEEESMSKAIIVHSLAAGTDGGAYTTLNVWQQAPLTSILSQLNPDGTAASFCTMGTNQFTLAAGVYRIRGWSIMSDASAGVKLAARLYNVTTALPAWNGLNNEISNTALVANANDNTQLQIGGDINLAGSTLFEIQGLSSATQTLSGFGKGNHAGGFTLAKELFRFLEIIKTA